MQSSGLIPEPLKWNRGSRAENLPSDVGACGRNLGSGTCSGYGGPFSCMYSQLLVYFLPLPLGSKLRSVDFCAGGKVHHLLIFVGYPEPKGKKEKNAGGCSRSARR